MNTSELIGLGIAGAALFLAYRQFSKDHKENVMTHNKDMQIPLTAQRNLQGAMYQDVGSGEPITPAITSKVWDMTRQNDNAQYITNQTAVEVRRTPLRNGNYLVESVGSGGNTGQLIVSDTGKGGQGSVSGADVYVGSNGKQTPEEATDYGIKAFKRIAAKDGKAFQNISENERLGFVKKLGYDPLGKWIYVNGEWIHK